MVTKSLLIIPLVFLCVSAASGQSASRKPKETKEPSEETVLTCRPQKPLSHTWICIDQNGKEITNLIIKDRDAK